MLSENCLFAILLLVITLVEIYGHGMMLDPPNRSSLWRFDPTAPINYNDNQNYCGGFAMQWTVNKGKCGPCGDNYADPIPRENENTGKYGKGKIAKVYKSGSIIEIYTHLNVNHKGWFDYSLCKLKDASQPEVEKCFKPLLFADGSQKVRISNTKEDFYYKIRLPKHFKCKRCVLRWNYKTANSWGICENGSGGMGCGAQETFRSCADIAII